MGSSRGVWVSSTIVCWSFDHFQCAVSFWDVATDNPKVGRCKSSGGLSWSGQRWPGSDISLALQSCQCSVFQKHKNTLGMHRKLLQEVSVAVHDRLSDI